MMNLSGPDPIKDNRLRFDHFEDKLFNKTPRLPAMGWNSWNAFGSGNTEELTKAMVFKIKELELDKLGLANPEEYIRSEVNKVNNLLPSFMRVSKIIIRKEDFVRTPAMKIIRGKANLQ